MALAFVPVAEHGFAATAVLLNRAFQDYLVKLTTDAAALMQMARIDAVDFGASLVGLRDGAPVGAALIARRGWTSRLAGMALVPEARRQGVGRAMVKRLLDDARARGDRTLVLEVIEQNAAAVALYESSGFVRVRRLVGFSRPPQDGKDGRRGAVTLSEVDLRSVAHAIAVHGLPDLPWQISAETIAHLTPPAVGYHCRGAWAAVANPDSAQPNIRALVVERAVQRQGRAEELLRALRERHPGKEWIVTARWPEELGSVFTKAEFERTALSQWQMSRAIP